jgi:pimeloyl-ACP methyl ester carboxylesterase
VGDGPALHVEEAGKEPLGKEPLGERPLIVLAHGFAGSARNFRPQARALRDAWRVRTYDARGHARSEAPEDPGAYDLAAMVDDLDRVIGPAQSEPAVVGGLSMGAAVALQLALARPERVRALVLAAWPADRDAPGARAFGGAFADAIDREGLEAAGEKHAWGPGSGLDPVGARIVRQGFLEHPPHALSAILRGVLATLPSTAELVPALARVRVPVLLVAGAGDAPAVEASRALAAGLPDGRLEVIPDAGHVVNLVQPKRFNDALRAFLDGLGGERESAAGGAGDPGD